MRFCRIYPFLFLMSLCQISLGVEYDPLLLRAQATMFPKIIMLDKEISEKAINGVVSLTILYDSNDSGVAEKLKELILQKYGSKLNNMTLEVNLSRFSDVNDYKLSTAYFLLRGTPETHKALTHYAAQQKRLVFCYDHNDFKHKTLISLLVKEKTYIYLNKAAIHDYNIKFQPVFYKIIKVIE